MKIFSFSVKFVIFIDIVEFLIKKTQLVALFMFIVLKNFKLIYAYFA